MKSFSVNGTDPTKQEKILAYMAPAPHEVRGDDKDDPTTYIVKFEEEEGARYLPLTTKLV